MKFKKFFRDFFRDCWEYASFFWSLCVVGSILDIIGIIQTSVVFTLSYFLIILPIIIILPFIIYYIAKFEKSIKIYAPNHYRNGTRLPEFIIGGSALTNSSFMIEIGKKISNYYLFFTKHENIQTSVMIPNNRNFKIIDVRNPDYHVVKCKKRSENIYFININSLNLSSDNFKSNFEISRSLKSNLKKALKNKKEIWENDVICLEF